MTLPTLQREKAVGCAFVEMEMASTADPVAAESTWQVELLRRQYLQLIDPNELAIPSIEFLRLPGLQARIYDSMFNEANIPFSPPDRYKYRVLKKLVAAIEQAIVDPEEDVGFPYSIPFVLGDLLPRSDTFF